EVDEFRTAVAQAETDLKAGRPGAVLQAIGQLDRLVSERLRTRQQEEQRRGAEMARPAATGSVSAKTLNESPRTAPRASWGGASRGGGARGRGRARPSRGAENRRRPQDLLGTGDRIPSEGAGRRPCADRRDPEDDRGPVPGRHLDPRRG